MRILVEGSGCGVGDGSIVHGIDRQRYAGCGCKLAVRRAKREAVDSVVVEVRRVGEPAAADDGGAVLRSAHNGVSKRIAVDVGG